MSQKKDRPIHRIKPQTSGTVVARTFCGVDPYCRGVLVESVNVGEGLATCPRCLRGESTVKIKKRPKGEYLREIMTETGLKGRPGVDHEIEYLDERLTADELAAVARLLDRVLMQTHCVTHLPYFQGLHAIRDEMNRREKVNDPKACQ